MSEISQAADAFEEFTGHTADRSAVYDIPFLPEGEATGYLLGKVDGISYIAKRDGVKEAYFHQFEKNAAPDLISTYDGSGLILAGGDYSVTDHGIEDNQNMQLLAINPSKRGQKKEFVQMAKHKSKTAKSAKVKTPTKEVMVYVPNPTRPKKRKTKPPVKVVYRKRNPSRSGSMGKLQGLLVEPIAIAAGGIASSVAVAFMPLSDNMKKGPIGWGVKVAVGVAMGMALSKVNKTLAKNVTQGAIVIATYDYMKTLLPTSVPISGFVDPPLNGLMNANDLGLGAFTSAQVYQHETQGLMNT